MRALKIAGAAIAAVIVVMALLLMVGIPSGFMTQAVQDRVERETGYRLVVSGATRLGIWPSLNVTLNDISVQDPKARDTDSRLTIGSVQADIPLRSALSGHPQVSELVITKPVLYVPLRRERDARIDNSPKPATTPDDSAANDFTIDHVKVIDGAVVFANLRDRVENRIEGIDADVMIGADRQVAVTGNARAGEQPLKFDIKAALPAGSMERRNIPVELMLDRRPAVAVRQGASAGERRRAANQRPERHAGWRAIQRLGLGRSFQQASGKNRSRLPASRSRHAIPRAARRTHRSRQSPGATSRSILPD